MIQTPVIITFANQKGGVGKTTLCVTFANYLVTKGVRVAIVDCDFQHSIIKCRKADIKKYDVQYVPYDVLSYEANDKKAIISLIEKMHNDQSLDVVLMDSPGIHAARNKLDARMTQTAAASLKDVDVTLMLFEPTGEFTESELGMVEALRKAGPAIAVINKVDLLNDFAALEARKKQVEEFGIFDAIVTVSAKDGTGCEELFPLLKRYANPGPHYFDDDAFTDMPEKELVAELVREKALLFMREEIPHGIAVTVESFKERPDSDLIDISVEICCERKSHKGMIIGKGGQMLRKIASAARMDCEELLGARVNLQCWVKVREDWRDNDRLLDNLGFAKP